jgi:spore germination protein GerM
VRATRAILLVLAVAALLVACGVPEDDSPQALSAEDVPFGLLSTPPTTTTTPPNLPPSHQAQLYFLDADSRLVPVTREVQDRDPETILETLLGTETGNIPDGLTSAIPPDTVLLGTSTEDEVVTVNLSEEFTSIQGEPGIAAVAQIVYTVTDRGLGVEGVLFQVEGEEFNVSDQTGAQQTEPVNQSDYREFAPLA